jgi:serine/threonine protein kinase
MPPEAFKGDISPAWDLWSLGIMLIEMTTNQLPYKFNNDLNQLMARVMNCDLQIPSLPREFKGIIEGCLQKDRRQRWTAQKVLNALQPQATGKMPVSQIPLKTAKADFTQLDQYLAQGKWKEADQETVYVMCKIVSKGKNQGYLIEGECKNFPREELKIIDNLWVKYSKGKFGFSMQKKIWLECGGKIGIYDINIFRKFADKVGWRKWGNWLKYSQFNFTINAPPAHFPCVYLGIGSDVAAGSVILSFSLD